ncbi:uncharacterized protein [Miscanthus floridulus]|uniref:uncharacterized protein n=1 Tax=Miscanthus floridulus TaxID=154761 RepID=UPI003457A49B
MGSPEGPAQGHQASRAGARLRRPHHPVHRELREGVRVKVEQRRLRGVPIQLPHQRGGAGGVQRAALRPPGPVHQRAAGLQDRRVQHGDGERAVGAGEDEPRGRLLVAVVQRGHQLAGRPRLHQGRPGGAAQYDVGQVRLPVVHHLRKHQLQRAVLEVRTAAAADHLLRRPRPAGVRQRPVLRHRVWRLRQPEANIQRVREKMWQGSNKISILNAAVGLPNQGTHYEAWNVGVLGPVTLSGLNEGKRDLSNQKWTYQIGVHSVTGSSSVEWGSAAGKQPLTWHKAYFNAPVALDMGSMGKGQAWVNGHHIGRYWSYKASGSKT